MNFFQPLDGHVLLRHQGVFSEHQLYVLGNELFARKGNGYIRLYENNATSKSKVFWQDLRMNQIAKAHMGKLVLNVPAQIAA